MAAQLQKTAQSQTCGCGSLTLHFQLMITQKAVHKIAFGPGTGNSFITSHGLKSAHHVRLQHHQPRPWQLCLRNAGVDLISENLGLLIMPN